MLALLAYTLTLVAGPTSWDLMQGGRATGQERLASFLCTLQPRLRWHRGHKWTSKECREAAGAYIAPKPPVQVAGLDEIHVDALLGVAESVQESDMVDGATRKSGGGTDVGLMGIRTPSQWTRGLSIPKIAKISTNISIGMQELQFWKQTKIPRTSVKKVRGADGRIEKRMVTTYCDHENGHEWYGHHQMGYAVSKNAFHAAYDRRVAAIYMAIAARLGEEPVEIRVPARHVEPAGCEREHKRPAGCLDKRTRELVKTIREMPWSDPAEPAELTTRLP